MEVEFVALDVACVEIEWLKNFLSNIPLMLKHIPLISMHCDCQATITKAKSKNFNEKRRHLRVQHKFIRQLISHDVVSIDFVR